MLIALDIGGVCINIHPERCFGVLGYRAISEVPHEILYALERYERGIIGDKEFLQAFRDNSFEKLSDEFIINAWNSILGEEMAGMNELVTKLIDRGDKIVLLSDTSKIHINEFRRRYEIAKQLPNGIYSFIVGAKKPEPAMYAAFEAEHGRPDLYIDDRAVCIEGGMAANWDCHQFQNAATLGKLLF